MGGLHCLNPRLFVLAKVTWNLEPRWYQKKGGMDRPQTRTERAETSVDARHCAVEVCQRSTMARSPPQGWRKDAHLAGWNYLTFPSGILPITVSQSQFCLVFTISTSLKTIRLFLQVLIIKRLVEAPVASAGLWVASVIWAVSSVGCACGRAWMPCQL